MAKKKTEKSLEQTLKEALVKEEVQPYAVPGNWDFVKLGKVVQINPPRYKPEIDDAELCSFVPMKAVSDKFGIIDNIETKPYGKIKNGYTSFKENDVLFAKITPCMENGKAAIARNLINGFGYGTTEFFVLRCSKMVSNMFLYYLVRSQSFRDSAKPNMTGTVGQRRVPKAYLDNYKFPIPPLPEQKRIVQKLSSMLGKLKEAGELIQETKDTFEERRAAILNKAFTGELTQKWREENPDVESAKNLIELLIDKRNKLGKDGKKGGTPTYEEIIIKEGEQPYNVPRNWKWIKLRELLCKIDKKDPKKEGIKKFTYLDISSIDNKEGMITDPKTYKGVEAPSRARQIVKTNDILFSTVRTYLKNIAMVDEVYNNQIASTGFCVMRCCEIINCCFLFRFVRSDIFIDRLNGFQRGISYPAVKTSDLLEQPIPLPSLSEQKEIVRILDNLLGYEDEAGALIDMEEQIDLLEKSILSKAFRGELGTNDPDDEPAIELLKRSLKDKVNVSQI